MATFVNDYLVELNERWKEVDILIEQAEQCKDTNEQLYNALCRSISILVVSHMEGFIKDMAKTVINDVNYNLDFSNVPMSMKRTFFSKYLGFDCNQNKLDNMIDDFSEYKEVKIKPEPFLSFDNKNPKPSIIKDVLFKFGVSDVFKNLHESFFDNSFESRAKANLNLRRLKKVMDIVSSDFPYRASMSRFNMKKSKYNNRTLWQEFLDELNQIRHKIVHGNTFDNFDSIQDIKLRRDKVNVLQLLVMYVICAKINEDLSN